MREAAFIKANKDKWLAFENVLQHKKNVSADELADLYLEVTDHLSFARTFYPQSNTSSYLNQLASQSHLLLYKTKKNASRHWFSFFSTDFPLMFYQYRSVLAVAFLVFVVFSAIGAFSAATDAAFVRRLCQPHLAKHR